MVTEEMTTSSLVLYLATSSVNKSQSRKSTVAQRPWSFLRRAYDAHHGISSAANPCVVSLWLTMQRGRVGGKNEIAGREVLKPEADPHQGPNGR